MPNHHILKQIHHLLEAHSRSRITQQDMAERLGISKRTYVEYLRGTNKPLGMTVVLDLLCELKEEEQIRVLKAWRELREQK
ncbi:helix-turn-helix domain-containing protein [Aeromonas hydrophila]|uniref:helix-turn-helix domain-containing protein n=1 Tax=Aeromonas hydrophila TaxID=644 RepID=UPI003AFA6256